MKKILIFSLGLFIFGCDRANKKTETQNATSTTTEEQSVEKGAGTEISPQLVGVQDSAKRLKVDTINSPEKAHSKEAQDTP